jgi:nitroimidazol reductase NimA-like FMN-containing flavoprotein (pyridoxamine 5'-phosphate oxidase superfamily)
MRTASGSFSAGMEARARLGQAYSVTLTDGIVLARSAFHHSVNYRSVMLLGRASKITDPVEKEAHLKGFMETLFPGRWAGGITGR